MTRRGRAVLGLVLLAVTTAGCGRSGGALSSATATPSVSTPPSPPAEPASTGTCRATTVRVSVTSNSPGYTGQRAVLLTVRNTGRRSCWVFGYPSVRLLDAHGTELPFTYLHEGGQAVTSAQPRRVDLAPGASLYVGVGKYRCDLAGDTAAETLVLALPGAQEAIEVELHGTGAISYCGPGQPGDEINLSPFVGTTDEVPPQL